MAPTTCAACGHPTTGVITTNGVMTTWLMVAASAHVAAIVVEHQRRLLGPLLLPRLMPNSESVGASHITARFPPPQVRGTAIFPPIFLERQTSSDPYLSIYLSRRVHLAQALQWTNASARDACGGQRQASRAGRTLRPGVASAGGPPWPQCDAQHHERRAPSCVLEVAVASLRHAQW